MWARRRPVVLQACTSLSAALDWPSPYYSATQSTSPLSIIFPPVGATFRTPPSALPQTQPHLHPLSPRVDGEADNSQ